MLFILSSKSTLLNSFEKGHSSSQIKKANLEHLFGRYSFCQLKRTCLLYREEEKSWSIFKCTIIKAKFSICYVVVLGFSWFVFGSRFFIWTNFVHRCKNTHTYKKFYLLKWMNLSCPPPMEVKKKKKKNQIIHDLIPISG